MILSNYNSEDLKNYSTNGDIKPLDFFDFEEHSMKIFSIINKLRRHPENFIKKLNYLISKMDNETHKADLISKYHTTVSFPEVFQPMDSIAFLEKISPKSSLLWSIKYNIIAFEELENSINQTNDDILTKTDLSSEMITKIKTNFVLDPMLTVLIIFLISEQNRKLIFSDDYSIATVATVCTEDGKILDSYSESGHTLIYFV